MDRLADQIKAAEAAQAASSADSDTRRMRRKVEDAFLRESLVLNVLPKMRYATPSEYKEWLDQWVAKGGKISAVSEGNCYGKVFIALESFNIPSGTCGAWSFKIIEPSGIKVGRDGYDHCEVLSFDSPMPEYFSATAYKDNSDAAVRGDAPKHHLYHILEPSRFEHVAVLKAPRIDTEIAYRQVFVAALITLILSYFIWR